MSDGSLTLPSGLGVNGPLDLQPGGFPDVVLSVYDARNCGDRNAAFFGYLIYVDVYRLFHASIVRRGGILSTEM